ncbi:hypothetical protein LTR56_025337 [Elasticomyces elasticus]|nr:hypothetical protein LTR22_027783 [Elasticomyces elasticus]KAK3617371.1 hypothetical protein LTR56_025337 [Elasticomyces elasticus]KAK5732629.1 hypothetical protein LTS12_027091 [Elasticomyces elasticus]
MAMYGDVGDESDHDIDHLSLWHVTQCWAFLPHRPGEERMQSFRKARARLERLSLINLDRASKAISCHSLGYSWARERIPRPDEVWKASALTLALSTEERRDWQPFTPSLAQHFEMSFTMWLQMHGLSSSLFDQREVCRIWYAFAWQMYRASSTLTVGICKQLAEETKKLFDRENDALPMADVQYLLSIAYQENGQIKEVLELLEHVVRVQERLAEDHPGRLASQHALAIAYVPMGR